MLDWFRDYLSNRTQCVVYDDVSSELMPVNMEFHMDQSWDLCYF